MKWFISAALLGGIIAAGYESETPGNHSAGAVEWILLLVLVLWVLWSNRHGW